VNAAATDFLFGGVPTGWRVLFGIALLIVVVMAMWSVSLYVRSVRWAARERRSGPTSGSVDDFLWVFFVPALNEAVTIRDSVSRLLQVQAPRRQIVVIDDGSEDGTSDVLTEIDHPDLVVVRRQPPDARKGKAAALNHAFRRLDLGDTPRDRVILAIVDADGRLAPDAPVHVSRHFADPQVGGVQCLVRIYNRSKVLAWFQHIEFGVYGHLFQAGRNRLGTAGMGGNGQFNRVSALDDVAEGAGPWRDRLTEDQDLGLRLIGRGWRGRQDLRATVDQQGLSKLRPLVRQRTRWSQGNLQAFDLAGTVARAPVGRFARAELLFQLFMPIMQGIIGVSLIAALVLALTGVAPFWAGGPTWQLLVVYLLAFGGTVLGCVAARRTSIRDRLIGIAIGHAYSFYTWLIWPVLVRSAARQLLRRATWAKTQREPLAPEQRAAA
jgi:cellulose synthase/poly-beta-1,6-N-acetylglucosamine synthase-like glycosyltransferase